MKRPSASTSRAVLGGLAFVALLAVPAIPVGVGVRGVVGVTPDVVVLLGALWLLEAGAWSSPVPRAGSWRAWLVALPWALLVVFECARAVTKYATNEDLPLYDSALLARHLYILARDLYGGLATAAFAAAALLPLVAIGAGALLLGRVEATLRTLGPRGGFGLLGAVALFVGACEVLPGTRWVTNGIVRNARASAALYGDLRSELSARAAPEVVLTERPDLVIYVVESYGAVCATAPDLQFDWENAVQALDEAAIGAGFTSASGWSVAPVQGGRSWIADMSVLLGLNVGSQAGYEHVLASVDALPSLPSFLAGAGYETVLVKPADRVRPGVVEENPYRFARTVFADDLDYRGPIVGWGRIPDQYTIEYVQEQVLDGIEAPTFAFFHLATAHLPWADVPPILGDWRSWNKESMPGRDAPIHADRSFESELGMRVSRFRRRPAETEPEADPRQRRQYLGTVKYDLAAIGRRLAAGVRRPTLVVVMGDHQPPIVAHDHTPEVPVHLFASDPALLGPFLERGFDARALPTPGTPSIAHHDLFDLLARALAAARAPGSPR